MDAVSDPLVETVVLMTSSQVGKTEILNNLVGYHIHQDPAPILVLHPTIEMGEAWSKDRLAAMLRDTPALRGKMSEAKARDAANTLRHKALASGHHITIAGANSPASLASRPIRILACDEVDRYPASAGTEGDPVSLAIKRTATFWNRKIVLVSTPTVSGQSRIEAAYNDSDQRQFWVPCPACGERQLLRWDRVVWPDGKPMEARYACGHCDAHWSDAERWMAVRRGQWRAEAEFRGTAGFRLNELYSTWRKLSETARDFVAAQQRPEMLKAWVNTALGEPWESRGEAPEWRKLYDRREDYRPGIVPRDALILTAGIDVQKMRVEMHVWGWGADRQSWLIDHLVINGSPFEPQVWQAASEMVQRSWQHEAGAEMRLFRVGADTGYATTQVEQWARRHAGLVIPVKGSSSLQAPIFGWSSSRDAAPVHGTRRTGLRHGLIGGHLATLELYGYLGLDGPTDEGLDAGAPYPPGYVHLCKLAGEEYCKQLVGDQWVDETGKWRQVHATEALDGWKYARAMLSATGIDRRSETWWQNVRAGLDAAAGGRRHDDPPPMPDVPPPGAAPALDEIAAERASLPQGHRPPTIAPARRGGKSAYMTRIGR
jgi:phage terminase large subunit GpA-like protein